jgi:hypothetical protein
MVLFIEYKYEVILGLPYQRRENGFFCSSRLVFQNRSIFMENNQFPQMEKEHNTCKQVDRF